MTIERTAIRVRQGGHNIQEDVIRRRFAHGLDNFERYKLLVDGCQHQLVSTPAVNASETTPARQRQRDNDSETTTARQRQRDNASESVNAK